MPPFRLRIPRPIFEELIAHALAERPNECCGLLSGLIVDDVGEVRAIHPLVNELQSPTEFASEPRGLFAAMKAMRASDTEILAVYHSHPTSPPVPSRRDLERNYSEQVINLIVGLAGPVPVLRGWWLTAESYREAEWSVVD